MLDKLDRFIRYIYINGYGYIFIYIYCIIKNGVVMCNSTLDDPQGS